MISWEGGSRVGCGCELGPEETKVLSSIFKFILECGKSPTLEQLRLSLGKSDKEIIRALDELEKKDLLVRKKATQEMACVYPVSLKPTEHRVFLENGAKLFAMCAVDALGMPIIFNNNARVISRCEECRSNMVFEIKNEEIVSTSHQDAVICSPKRQVYPAAETCCPFINFFCTREHAEEWVAKNSRLIDNIDPIVSVQQRFPKIKTCWVSYGELLGFR
jgi:hypothetical protein